MILHALTYILDIVFLHRYPKYAADFFFFIGSRSFYCSLLVHLQPQCQQ